MLKHLYQSMFIYVYIYYERKQKIRKMHLCINNVECKSS